MASWHFEYQLKWVIGLHMIESAFAGQWRAVPGGDVCLTGGALAERCQRNVDNLLMCIDAGELAGVYAERHGPWYAEPEFCGHYLDTAAQVFASTAEAEVMRRAAQVVDSIVRNQREDGYLGTYERGLEFDGTFSVWNETFTVKGLLSYYEEAGDERALGAAMRCADRLAAAYMDPQGPDLFLAVNQGVENICILSQLPRLYALSGKRLYLEFARHLLERAEATALKFVSGPTGPAPLHAIGCLKAAEMLICYAGLVDLYAVSGEEQYLEAAVAYWRMVNDSQIGVTGNGTIGECWTYVDLSRQPLSITTDLKPNENCAAVTWMKLSAALYAHTGDACYVDAMERTLYNHLLGAQALDGRDFSYYQGTRGRKVHATHPGQYSCCRYRGMNMLAHLPRYVYACSESGVVVNLYCSSQAELDVGGLAVRVRQETEYPRRGRVCLWVEPERRGRFAVWLRWPAWCKEAAVAACGEAACGEAREGYVRIEREWAAGDRVEFEMAMAVGCRRGRAEDREVAALSYGPLVLALDSRYGIPIEEAQVVLEDGECRLEEAAVGEGLTPLVRFEAPGRRRGAPVRLTLVDYASAGSVEPERDRFVVWLPVAGDAG